MYIICSSSILKGVDIKMRRKINYDVLITLIFLIVLGITGIYFAMIKNYEKVGRVALAAGTILAVKVLFKFTFLRKSKAAYISIISFVMIAIYLGNVLSLYTYIRNYDKILHLISGVIINIISVIIYFSFSNESRKNVNFKFMITFCIAFIMGCAGAWEIWEFTTDRLFGLQAQLNSLTDTMLDIICGTIGGILCLIITCISIIKRK